MGDRSAPASSGATPAPAPTGQGSAPSDPPASGRRDAPPDTSSVAAGREGSAERADAGAPSASLRLPVALGAVGAIAIAFSGIYVRLSGVTPTTSAVFRCVYAIPVLAVLAARETRAAGPRSWAQRRLSLAAGAAFAVDLVSWHYAIEVVGAGLATVLANVQVVIVGFVAWLVLNERPTRATIASVPIMLAGVTLISGVVGSGAYGDNPALGAVLGLVAAAAYSGFLLFLRAGNQTRQHRAGALLDATVVGGVGAAAAGLALGNLDLAPTWPAHGWLVVLALNSQVLGWLLISYALPRLPAILTSVLLLLQPVGAVALGVVLLGEDPSVVQLVGVGLVLVGLVVTTASGASRRRGARPAAT